MAKMNGFEKQDIIISQFEKQNRKTDWEKRNPHLRELTLVEQMIQQSKREREAFEKRKKQNPPKPYISHYNPNNPLNGSSSWNKEQREAYNKAQKLANKSK
jgi:hypothetical protein